MSRIGWYFPPTGGGQSDGYNNPGLTHFAGSPLASLARETIQNSLDAHDSEKKNRRENPVQVVFELRKINGKDSLARQELATIIDQCLEAACRDSDQKAIEELGRANEILQQPKLTFLRIVDRHTTGLKDKHWDALIKKQGTSVKEAQGAGGFYGIGKYAPFVVSPLRTVFYWSRFEDEGQTIERCQGKAVLMSHLNESGEETQGIGFYGHADKCAHLTHPNIPEEIQGVESLAEGNGTSLWIAGFVNDAGWQRRIACSVIENFFCAIDDKQLSVIVEPNTDMKKQGLIEINADTLDQWFDYLLTPKNNQKEEYEALSEACAFRKTMKTNFVLKEKKDNQLGLCKLWISLGDDLPSKVALIRQTGMLITSQQKKLLRFHNARPFGAVCRFSSGKGNELLRQMENPQHNQFEPDRLPEGNRKLGERALKRIVDWIREEIKAYVTPLISNQASVINELAEMLPDREPDDAFGPNEDGDLEPALKGAPVIRIRPRQKRATDSGLEDEEEGDGEDTGNEGGNEEGEGNGGNGGNGGSGGNGEGGEGDGEGGGGTGGRGGNEGKYTAVRIKNVRYLPKDERQCQILFTPTEDATQASIQIKEAGDSVSYKRDDLEVIAGDKRENLADYRIDLAAEKRYDLTIAGAQPIDGRAWQIQVTTLKD